MLSEILAVPCDPNEIPNSEDWVVVNEKIGPLPDDYYEFINVYGTGLIDEFIWIFNPAARNDNLNLIVQYLKQSAVVSEVLSSSQNKSAFEGLRGHDIVPFGITDNGDLLFWLKSGSSNEWPVVVFPPREDSYETFCLSMTQFIYDLLAGKLKSRYFPEDFPTPAISFVSV